MVTSTHWLQLGAVAVCAQKRLESAQHCHRVVSTALPAPAPTHAARISVIYFKEWRIGWTQPSRLSRAPTAGLADGSALVLETKESTATQSGKGPPNGRGPGYATSKNTAAILNLFLNHCIKATRVGGREGVAARVYLGG